MRISAFLTVFLLTIGLLACGGAAEEGAEDTTAVDTTAMTEEPAGETASAGGRSGQRAAVSANRYEP